MINFALQVQEFFSFEPDTFISPDPTVDLDLDSFLNPKTCTSESEG